MGNAQIWIAAVFLLLALPAYAMNKCVDANGKVTYQQDPCPGKVVRAAPTPPAAAAEPAASAAPAEKPKPPARPALAEGNTACERVRQKIAEIYEGWPAKTPQEISQAEQMIARAKQEYSYCNL
jgi:hypothetical protein